MCYICTDQYQFLLYSMPYGTPLWLSVRPKLSVSCNDFNDNMIIILFSSLKVSSISALRTVNTVSPLYYEPV